MTIVPTPDPSASLTPFQAYAVSWLEAMGTGFVSLQGWLLVGLGLLVLLLAIVAVTSSFRRRG